MTRYVMKNMGYVDGCPNYQSEQTRLLIYREPEKTHMQFLRKPDDQPNYTLVGGITLTRNQVLRTIKELITVLTTTPHSGYVYESHKIYDTKGECSICVERWTEDDAMFVSIYTHEAPTECFLDGMFLKKEAITQLMDYLLRAIQPTWWWRTIQ